MRGVLLLVIFLFLASFGNSVVINEIMYNPSGDEFDFEYLELYGDEDISGWYFEGIDFQFPNDTIINEYLVIVNTIQDEGEDNDFKDRYPDIDVDFEYKGSLLNTGEIIILRDNEEEIIDFVAYDDWVDENHSLERKDIEGYSSDPDNWVESINGGSPGKENSISQSSGCDWELSIIIDSSISKDPEWQFRATRLEGSEKADIVIEHWIENSYGDKIKTYSDIHFESVTNKKTSSTYSPSLTKGDGYVIKAEIIDISCEDKYNENNALSQLIFVQDEKKNIFQDSQLIIKNIPDSVKFGDEVKTRLSVYRGNTSKYAVYATVTDKNGKKVSEESSMQFRNKFTNYTVSIPIQLKPNCNEKEDDGEYIVVVEGLDQRVEEEIDIEGIASSSCQIKEVEKSSKKSKLSYNILEMPSIIYQNQPFEIVLDVENDGDEDADIDIESYVYRGKKRYSVTVKEKTTIDEDDSREITIENIVKEAKTGDYKLKVKLKKKGRKTTYDKTRDIHIIAPEVKKVENSVDVFQETKAIENSNVKTITRTSDVIYESNTFLIKKSIPYLLVFLFFFAVIFSLVALNK